VVEKNYDNGFHIYFFTDDNMFSFAYMERTFKGIVEMRPERETNQVYDAD
jgi:hypothetical protein